MASLDANQWEQLRCRVEAETGMDLSGKRISRFHDAVCRLLGGRDDGTSLQQFAAWPDRADGTFERLTAALTVGESFFFRNEHHFRALQEFVIPEILRRHAEDRKIRIWSAGCAGGEEPYSVAILLDQVLSDRDSWSVSILGTDLNPEFLDRARAACYRPWSFRRTEIHKNRAYFTPDGDMLRLVPRIRQLVRFAYLNLVKDVYPSALTGTLGLDLILFRNVAIYLQPEVTQAIVRRLHQALLPGGWLLLGETEVSLISTEGFDVMPLGEAILLRKVGGEGWGAAVTGARPPFPILQPETESLPATRKGLPASDRQKAVAKTPLPEVRRCGTIRRSPQPTAQQSEEAGPSAWQRIEQLMVQGEFDLAEREIDRIPRQADRAKQRLQYIRCLLACAESSRARTMLDRCLSEEPLLIEAQLLQAGFAEEAGELDAAEEAYRRALYIDRDCPIVHFHLAMVLQQKGEAAAAAESLSRCMRLADEKDAQAPVEYGEGVCYGRFREMVSRLVEAHS